MTRFLAALGGAVLLLVAVLLVTSARESEASAQAVTKACTDAARAKAAADQRLFDANPVVRDFRVSADISH